MAELFEPTWWTDYQDLLPMEAVQKALELPAAICRQEIKHVIPTIEIGPAGRRIARVCIVTDDFIGDIRLDVPRGEHFDFVRIKTISNWILEAGEHHIPRENAEPIVHQIMVLTLRHFGSSFVSKLSYIGPDPKPWLRVVLEAFPISLMVSS